MTALVELFRYRALVRNLVLKDLKLKYRGSVLGVAWSLAHPLLLLAVYTVAFKYVMRLPVEHYQYFLMVGLLPWAFFASSLQASTGAIVFNGSLLRKIYFPRHVLPIAAVLFNFAQLLLALGALLPALALWARPPVSWLTVLLVPMLLLLHLAFTVGLALVLSAVTAFFRDVAHLTEVSLVLLFWLTPIAYPETMVPPGLQALHRANPFAAFAIGYRALLLDGGVPSASVIVTIVGATAASIVAGYVVFGRMSPKLAEQV